MIRLKRVYDVPTPDDGYRILIDRLWPRGLTREKANIDLWLKDVAPSNDLRKRFGHDPAKWHDFENAYWSELDKIPDVVKTIQTKASHGTVTLVYSAHDNTHNNAVALARYLEGPV